MKHIFYVHKGNADYLEVSLRCARIKNPKANIILLGDQSNDIYDFVKHSNIGEYSRYANEFKKLYIHLSSNTYEYELICIQRWFIILEYMEKHSIKEGYYQDSDVILDYDINEFNIEGKIYYSGKTAGVCFFSYEALKKVCDFIIEVYSNENRMQQLFEFLSYIDFGGICDITLFMMFINEFRNISEDISLERDGSVFDICILHYENYERIQNKKKIYVINNKLYVKNIFTKKFIKINTVHFQGNNKRHMSEFIKYMKLDSDKIKYFNYETQRWEDEENNNVFISESVLINILRSYKDDEDKEKQRTIDMITKYLHEKFTYNSGEPIGKFLGNMYYRKFLKKFNIYNKKIIGWGVGNGINIYKEIFNSNIDYLISSSKSDSGKVMDGVSVFLPNKLLEEDKSRIYVIVLSINYYTEIKNKLIEFGFREKADFIGLEDIINGIDNM